VPVIQPSARTVPLLRAAALALKAADKGIRSDINKHTRATLNPIWRQAIAARANRSRMDQAVFGAGARIAAGNPARAIAASSRRPLRSGDGGFVPNTDARSLEFGTDRGKRSTYDRKGHQVTRRTRTGLPARNRKGRVVYPAFADVAPRMVSLWVQIIVRNIHESLERK
jgi:hypothetical protein